MKSILASLAVLVFATTALAGGAGTVRPSILFKCDKGVSIAWDNVHTYVILGLKSEPRATEWNFSATGSLIKFPNDLTYLAYGPFKVGTKGILSRPHHRGLVCVQVAEDI